MPVTGIPPPALLRDQQGVAFSGPVRYPAPLSAKSASRSPHSEQRKTRAQSGSGVPDEGGRSEHGGHSPRPSSVLAGQDVASSTRRGGPLACPSLARCSRP